MKFKLIIILILAIIAMSSCSVIKYGCPPARTGKRHDAGSENLRL